MDLTVNEKKKKVLHKKMAKNMKAPYIIALLAKALLFIGLIGGAVYLIINYASPSLSMADVNGVFMKDDSYIIITSSFIFAPCLIFSACLNVLAKNLSGVKSAARVDESLIVSNTRLQYAFRLKHQSLSSERRVITIDLSKISAINYESDTEQLVFIGSFLSEYYDDYKNSKPVDAVSISEFVICDYFTPSLKEVLLENSVSIFQ